MKKLVSVIIPTKNSAGMLRNCLRSINNQTYTHIEVIIVDGGSSDDTVRISQEYNAKIYTFKPKVKEGTFDATHKRNYGVAKASGDYIYYVDADMELDKNLIKEAVQLAEEGYDALIIPEISFGVGVWASAKDLERRCYFGDTTIEAPRFFKKSVWVSLGGLDENLAGGRDDGDMYFKLLEHSYRVGRTSRYIRHNEGELTVKKLFMKKLFYGKDVLKYVKKRPVVGIKSYMPLRWSYIRNWELFLRRPKDAFFFVLMKIIESTGGVVGVVSSVISR